MARPLETVLSVSTQYIDLPRPDPSPPDWPCTLWLPHTLTPTSKGQVHSTQTQPLTLTQHCCWRNHSCWPYPTSKLLYEKIPPMPSALWSLPHTRGWDLVCLSAPRERSPELCSIRYTAPQQLLHLQVSPSPPCKLEGKTYFCFISLLSATSTGPDTCRGFNTCWLLIDSIKLPKKGQKYYLSPVSMLHLARGVVI